MSRIIEKVVVVLSDNWLDLGLDPVSGNFNIIFRYLLLTANEIKKKSPGLFFKYFISKQTLLEHRVTTYLRPVKIHFLKKLVR